jgi:putative transposase
MNRVQTGMPRCAKTCSIWQDKSLGTVYRRLHVLLEKKDHKCSAMRLFRLYQQEGLAVRRLKKKRLSRSAVSQTLHVRPNQEWALDFVSDRLETGRGIRVLTIVDAFTRECLGVDVDTSLSSRRVTRALEQIIGRRVRHRAFAATMARN